MNGVNDGGCRIMAYNGANDAYGKMESGLIYMGHER